MIHNTFMMRPTEFVRPVMEAYVLVGGTGDEYSYSASGHPRGDSDIWQVYLVKVNAKRRICMGSRLWQ